MRMLLHLVLACCVAGPAIAEGPADERAPEAGHLVIVGGGLQAENEAVYRAVLDRIGEGGTLGVLPTASGIPEESGPGHVADFERYAGPDQTIVLLDIRNGDVDKANDPAWVAKIAACDGLWFTGGDQSRIVATFRPTHPETGEEADTLAYAAMWEVLNGGGVIGGTSAGAAMMSDPMIKWGNSHEALLLGVVNDVPDFGVGVGKGMGFLPGGYLVDQHFFERGRLGRLLVAMVNTGCSRGMGIGENSAAVFDLSTWATSVLGPKGVLYVGSGDRLRIENEHVLPASFFAGLWRDGFDTTKHGPGSDANDFAVAPEVEFIFAAISGAPRAYDGPAWINPVIRGDDEQWPIMRQFVLEGVFDLIHVKGNDPVRLRQAAQAALEAERSHANLNP